VKELNLIFSPQVASQPRGDLLFQGVTFNVHVNNGAADVDVNNFTLRSDLVN
jgi:hypothetical protein